MRERRVQREDVLFLLGADNGAHLSDRVMSLLLEECVMLPPRFPSLPLPLSLSLSLSSILVRFSSLFSREPRDTDMEEEINVRSLLLWCSGQSSRPSARIERNI